jgi:hypothetical protein
MHPDFRPYQNFLTEFSLLFRDSHNLNLTKTQLKALGSHFKALQPLYEQSNIKEKAGELKFNSNKQYDEFLPDMKNWISNGVWNPLCIPKIKGIKIAIND